MAIRESVATRESVASRESVATRESVASRESVSVDKETRGMVARFQSTITGDNTQIALMLQRMPPTFRAINEYRPTKLTLKVATDLFYWKASSYLLIFDHLSRYIEISKLNGKSFEIISHKINLC